MDILRKHVEKMAFGLALAGLAISCWFLLACLKRTHANVRQVQALATMPSSAGQRLPRLVMPDSPHPHAPDLIVALSPMDDADGSLVDPPAYGLCRSKECANLVPVDYAQCPFCGTKRDDKPVAPPGTDSDGDGIPDLDEIRSGFLNPKCSDDGKLDSDSDTFSNATEFAFFGRAEPLLDPSTHPPLATRLRYRRIYRRPVPIRIQRLARNGSEDPSRWDIVCKVADRGRQATRIVRIGDTIGEFTIVGVQRRADAASQANGGTSGLDATPAILVRDDGNTTHALRIGQQAFERKETVTLVEISPGQPGILRTFDVRVGESFVLRNPQTSTAEQYQLSYTRETGIVVRRRDAEGDARCLTVTALPKP